MQILSEVDISGYELVHHTWKDVTALPCEKQRKAERVHLIECVLLYIVSLQKLVALKRAIVLIC